MRVARAGPRCCAISSVAACVRRWWPWATPRSASGRRCATCGPRRASSAAGCTGWSQRLQPRTKAALRQILGAESRAAAEQEIERFREEYGAKYPKAVASLTRDPDKLLTFFDFPAEHWKHLKTTNPIESAFATVRLRQRVTKGAGSRTRGLVFAYKLLDMASLRWRRLDGAQLLPLVRAGVRFNDGVMQERQSQDLRKEAA